MSSFLLDQAPDASAPRTLADITINRRPTPPIRPTARLTLPLRMETLSPRATRPIPARVAPVTLRLPVRTAPATTKLHAAKGLMDYTEKRSYVTTRTAQPARTSSWLAFQDWLIKAVAVSVLIVTLLTGASVIEAAQATSHPVPAPTPVSYAAQQQLNLLAGATQDDQPILDTSCHAIDTTKAMITPQQIAHPVSVGYRFNERGANVTQCMVKGLQVPAAPTSVSRHGQVILVSTTKQWLWAYQDGKLVYATPVTTGMPYLRTPRGTYSVMLKESDVTFYSPWPVGSPFYYSPEHIDYALRFRNGGFYIHNAAWRDAFGPGTQDPHTDPNGKHETGSHGCVNVATSAARWLYNWAHIGATVTIV
jgi:lipoprotein-anchoring transpeptidase ErfK/SrfK